ncbi:MAG TPA: response regulator transcription factor [Devosia sp.]|jgi:FixJ family two-component response regulator|nr:response regulator transcription factor [Devosia sp.]
MSAHSEEPIAVLVDDDQAVCEALGELLNSVGLDTMSFSSSTELLAAELPDRPSCIVLDVRMPGLSGLDLQHHLAAHGIRTPIVFLTGHGDIAMSVEAMKAGAIDFLTKPVRDQTFLDAVSKAIKADLERRSAASETKKNLDLFETLTPRERQVLRYVVRGMLNKQIAYELDISEVTVKLHRSSMMRKMNATSTAHLFGAWQSMPAEIRAGDG